MPVGLLYDELMETHQGPEHVEQPLRIIRMLQTLEELGLAQRCWRLASKTASAELLRLAHSPEHIAEAVSHPFISKGDMYFCSHTAAAARMAAGCCVEAVRAVLSGTVSSALAIVRPPGHHAECARAQGFCFFNNVAVAARAAQQLGRDLAQPVRRVAVLDWDVHHGNGIQEVLWEDPSVLYISIHR
ncbi:hist_deacetyl domain-containing protein, partial [Haematococcus lacustris]